MGINRNIVECKDVQRSFLPVYVPVLIETLWNVKMICGAVMAFHLSVLIETLWNVKCSTTSLNTRTNAVLIETLWNVKSEMLDVPI